MSAVGEDTINVDRPPPIARGWPRERIVGHLLIGLWIAIGIGLVAYLTLSWKTEFFAKYAPAYISGLGVTMALVIISIVIGAILSAPIAYARMSRNPLLSAPAYAYVYFFRGTPLLAQTFLVYYGLGSFRRELEAVGLWVVLPRGLVLRDLRLLAEHGRLPGRDPARRHRERVERSVGRRGLARPAQAPDLVEGHPAAGADRGAAALWQRGHPDDQGLGDRLPSSRSTI